MSSTVGLESPIALGHIDGEFQPVREAVEGLDHLVDGVLGLSAAWLLSIVIQFYHVLCRSYTILDRIFGIAAAGFWSTGACGSRSDPQMNPG